MTLHLKKKKKQLVPWLCPRFLLPSLSFFLWIFETLINICWNKKRSDFSSFAPLPKAKSAYKCSEEPVWLLKSLGKHRNKQVPWEQRCFNILLSTTSRASTRHSIKMCWLDEGCFKRQGWACCLGLGCFFPIVTPFGKGWLSTCFRLR